MNWLTSSASTLRSWFRREPQPTLPDFLQYELHLLATYNAECARGIVHTPEYDAQMRDLQRQFNRAISRHIQ
jgi:hypothetical protein